MQNHNYAVDPASLPEGVEVTHINLNDGSCAGLAFPALKLMSLQYHPEASPGPHDSDTCKRLADCDIFCLSCFMSIGHLRAFKSWPKHRI